MLPTPREGGRGARGEPSRSGELGWKNKEERSALAETAERGDVGGREDDRSGLGEGISTSMASEAGLGGIMGAGR